MYIIFNEGEDRILCRNEYLEYWTGQLRLITKLIPLTYTSKFKAMVKAWLCSGVVVEFRVEDIPEDEYLIGGYVYCWILDTDTGEVEKTDGYLQVYLDRVRYKLVNWD